MKNYGWDCPGCKGRFPLAPATAGDEQAALAEQRKTINKETKAHERICPLGRSDKI